MLYPQGYPHEKLSQTRNIHRHFRLRGAAGYSVEFSEIACLKMIILLIGPSAVGKTTLGQLCASQMQNCEFVDLDDAVARLNGTSTAYESAVKFGLPKFLIDCRDIVANCALAYASINVTLLIAVGEWALRMEEPEIWLSAYKTISLMAPAEEVYQRRNHLTEMSLEGYSRYNYSDARKKIFADCTIALHISGLTQEESVETLKEAVQSLRLQTYREGEYIHEKEIL